MRRAAASLATTAMLASTAPIVLASTAESFAFSPLTGCVKNRGFHGCVGAGRVRVNTGLSHPGTPSTSSRPSRPTAELPGAIRLVGCGVAAGGQLAALGDPYGAADARGACASSPVCDDATQRTGVRHRQYVRVVKQADGTWSLNGATCNAV